MARQIRNRRAVSGITLADAIGAIAVIPILAVLSVPSFPNVTEAYRHREALRNVERPAKTVDDAGSNLLTKDRGQ